MGRTSVVSSSSSGDSVLIFFWEVLASPPCGLIGLMDQGLGPSAGLIRQIPSKGSGACTEMHREIRWLGFSCSLAGPQRWGSLKPPFYLP